ncbi:hypothetical protein HJG60_010380 [Phyllostomus discolor]|uniref:Uncharacterized protein n=1 Tax=Phyllostomus discolor TaxID=89673 RepID=A0A834AWS2_9CHIR|nr:hypothetical protein HJG60_010380 [Phyllostomus discolor]
MRVISESSLDSGGGGGSICLPSSLSDHGCAVRAKAGFQVTARNEVKTKAVTSGPAFFHCHPLAVGGKVPGPEHWVFQQLENTLEQGSPKLWAMGQYRSGPVRSQAVQPVSLNVMCLNHPQTIHLPALCPPTVWEKMIFHKPVPGAKKVRDHCFRELISETSSCFFKETEAQGGSIPSHSHVAAFWQGWDHRLLPHGHFPL